MKEDVDSFSFLPLYIFVEKDYVGLHIEGPLSSIYRPVERSFSWIMS